MNKRLSSTLLAIALLSSTEAMRAQTVLADGSVISDTPPPGAPVSACTVPLEHDAAKLRAVKGDAPMTYVFACGHNRPAGQCAVMTSKPGSIDLPANTRFMSANEQQSGWTCVAQDSTSGWVPSDRLVPLSPTPAITTGDWLGWWQQGKDTPGIKNDRILITRSKVPKTLHVSGRAYWYGMNDNVHYGGVDADASAYGDTLHIVDGDDAGACIVDLVYHPATHTFTASDNMNCGGMNVRFLREWHRFTPSTRKGR